MSNHILGPPGDPPEDLDQYDVPTDADLHELDHQSMRDSIDRLSRQVLELRSREVEHRRTIRSLCDRIEVLSVLIGAQARQVDAIEAMERIRAGGRA
jgi:hypothetical protein